MGQEAGAEEGAGRGQLGEAGQEALETPGPRCLVDSVREASSGSGGSYSTSDCSRRPHRYQTG